MLIISVNLRRKFRQKPHVQNWFVVQLRRTCGMAGTGTFETLSASLPFGADASEPDDYDQIHQGGGNSDDFPSWWDNAIDTVKEGAKDFVENVKSSADYLAVAKHAYDADFLAKLGLDMREAGRVAQILLDAGFTKEEVNKIARMIFHMEADETLQEQCFKIFLQVDDFEDTFKELADDIPEKLTRVELQALLLDARPYPYPEPVRYTGFLACMKSLYPPAGDTTRSFAVERMKSRRETEGRYFELKKQQREKLLRGLGGYMVGSTLRMAIGDWKSGMGFEFKQSMSNMTEKMNNLVREITSEKVIKSLKDGDVEARERELRNEKDSYIEDLRQQVLLMKEDMINLRKQFNLSLLEKQRVDERCAELETKLWRNDDEWKKKIMQRELDMLTEKGDMLLDTETLRVQQLESQVRLLQQELAEKSKDAQINFKATDARLKEIKRVMENLKLEHGKQLASVRNDHAQELESRRTDFEVEARSNEQKLRLQHKKELDALRADKHEGCNVTIQQLEEEVITLKEDNDSRIEKLQKLERESIAMEKHKSIVQDFESQIEKMRRDHEVEIDAAYATMETALEGVAKPE